jgi:hypothetical protein
MSSVVIASNQQSALLSTLNSASGSLVQPFEYSISKRVPAHGKSVIEFNPTNPAATTASSVMSWDLPKTGIVRNICLKLDVEHTETNGFGMCLPADGWLSLIDRIEIESSSRKLLTHTKASLLAAYSDLPMEARASFERGLHMHKALANGTASYALGDNSGAGSTGDVNKITLFVPFLFCFTNATNQSLMTEFLEPIRVSVKWGSNLSFIRHADGNGANVAAVTNPPVISGCKLILETVQLEAQQMDSLIAAQYGAGPLSQLTYDYFEETNQTGTMSAANAAGAVLKHEIKSTDVVSDIYVYVECSETPTNVAEIAAFGKPLPLKKVSFKASGQTLIEVDAEYVGLFGRRTMRDGFYGSCPANQLSNFSKSLGSLANPGYIYRLQMGLSNDHQFDSGSISLRELNSPTVEVTMETITSSKFNQDVDASCASKALKMHVILRTQGLTTTDSGSGRIVSTLSN